MDMILRDKSKSGRLVSNVMDIPDKDPLVSISAEPTPRDYIKKSAAYIQQALNVMYVIEANRDTPDEVKEKIRKIIDAFSVDKSELERIIRLYYDKRP